MFHLKPAARTLAALVVVLASAVAARADHLLNLKVGEPFPAFKLPTVDQGVLDSESLKGSVTVLVCMSAEQRSSELAAIDSRDIIRALGAEPVKLAYVTADLVQKPYFERFRQERTLDAPLAFDADRVLYRQLGLIVFPTTIVVGKDGKLAHVLALHGNEYSHVLDAYIRNALGKLTDEQLTEALKAKPTTDASPKSMISTYRARARLAREKGEYGAAKEELAKARELDPTNADILLDLADIDLISGNIDDADKIITTVLQAHPEQRRARQFKGIVLFRQNKLNEAEAILIQEVSLNPEPARIHYYLGRIYEAQGKPDKAMEHYREALKRVLKEADSGQSSAPTPAAAPTTPATPPPAAH